MRGLYRCIEQIQYFTKETLHCVDHSIQSSKLMQSESNGKERETHTEELAVLLRYYFLDLDLDP